MTMTGPIPKMTGPWVTAEQAAARLDVSRATLYAYVSRGHIRSQAMASGSRVRGYASEDVERLLQRAEGRRDPEKAAAGALRWGVPVLESAITLIDGRCLYYRGRNAVTLARTWSVEEVASLIWDSSPRAGREEVAHGRHMTRGGSPRNARSVRIGFVGRAQQSLARAEADDPGAFDVRPGTVAAAGRRILDAVVSAATGGAASRETIDAALARAWNADRRATDILRAALILCADHELNVSSFTARCIASAGSSPYAVVTGGLAALEGPRHGGASARVEAMLDSMRRSRDLRGAVAARLRRGESVDGFGHPLYPDGDPRAAALFDLLSASHAKSAELRFVLGVARAALDAGRGRPNVDFALAAVSRVLRLPPGAPLMLFAIGRTIGWIGHAIEQYSTGQLIRPRARYTGVQPA
jgi:citrate synthase